MAPFHFRRGDKVAGTALPTTAQMRPKTHHWVRADIIFQNFAAFFVNVKSFTSPVNEAEWKGPKGDDAEVRGRQLYVRGALNHDRHHGLGLAFKLANFLTEPARLDALRGTFLLHRNNSMYVHKEHMRVP